MIRPGRDGDASGLIALISACWAEYPGMNTDVLLEAPEVAALASHLAGKGGALWVAEAAGAVAGMVAAYPDGDAWQLSRMYVAAGHRGTGLASELLRTAEDHARDAGATRMRIWSDVLFTRAHAFYENHSYVRRGGLRALQDISNTIEAGYAKPLTGRVVEALDAAAAQSAERPLARLLTECVAAGVPLGFRTPPAPDRARGFWHRRAGLVGQGCRSLFAAWSRGALAGSVQLVPDRAEDGAHRAAIETLLVTPRRRCTGLARTLLAAAEAAARDRGIRLLTMQVPGDAHAAALYQQWGWALAGTVAEYWPGRELWVFSRRL